MYGRLSCSKPRKKMTIAFEELSEESGMADLRAFAEQEGLNVKDRSKAGLYSKICESYKVRGEQRTPSKPQDALNVSTDTIHSEADTPVKSTSPEAPAFILQVSRSRVCRVSSSTTPRPQPRRTSTRSGPPSGWRQGWQAGERALSTSRRLGRAVREDGTNLRAGPGRMLHAARLGHMVRSRTRGMRRSKALSGCRRTSRTPSLLSALQI